MLQKPFLVLMSKFQIEDIIQLKAFHHKFIAFDSEIILKSRFSLLSSNRHFLFHEFLLKPVGF